MAPGASFDPKARWEVLMATESLGLILRMPSNCHRLLEHARQEPGEEALVEHVLWHFLCHSPCSNRWDKVLQLLPLRRQGDALVLHRARPGEGTYVIAPLGPLCS